MKKLLLAGTLLFAAAGPVLADRHPDHASVGSDINVTEGESAGDLACVFCSVHVHGDVNGDIAVAFGNVTVDADRRVSGDVAIVGGDLNLGENAHVEKDVAIVAGDERLGEGAQIQGSRSVMPGRFWLLVPLAPLLILIGIIWLVVHLVRRNRYQFPVYPNGRGVPR